MAAPQQRDGVLTVLTLNIWGENLWEERKFALVEALDKIRPDVVALQEVVRSSRLCQASWLAGQTGMTAAYAAAKVERRHEFGNAVLSRWPIVHSRSLPLTPAGAAGDESRCVLTAEIRAHDRVVSISSTHLSWRFDEGWVREAQVRQIAEFVGAGTRDFPPVVCGDFNARPESTEVRFMQGLHALGGRSYGLFDAFTVARPDQLGFTWDNRNPYVAKEMTPNRRIDYIFVGEQVDNGAGVVLDAAVACNEPLRGVWPTDHFGVVARLACPAKSGWI